MYIAYSLILTVGFVLALPWFLWKGRATGKYLRTFRERMGRLPVYLNVDGDRSVWIHAVSVGEVPAARPLVEAMLKLRAGDRTLVRVEEDGEQQQLALYATEFRMRERPYTLVSLQNIRSELEEKEMEAWQNLIRVLTHEIMNSITPISSLASTVNGLLREEAVYAYEFEGRRYDCGNKLGFLEGTIALARDAIQFEDLKLNHLKRKGVVKGKGELVFLKETMFAFQVLFTDLDLKGETGRNTALSGQLDIQGNLTRYQGSFRFLNREEGWESVSLSGKLQGTEKELSLKI